MYATIILGVLCVLLILKNMIKVERKPAAAVETGSVSMPITNIIQPENTNVGQDNEQNPM